MEKNKRARNAIVKAGGRKKVAEMCGITYQGVKHWETRGVPTRHRAKIVKAAGYKPGYLGSE